MGFGCWITWGPAGNEDFRHIVVAQLLQVFQVVNWVGMLVEGNALVAMPVSCHPRAGNQTPSLSLGLSTHQQKILCPVGLGFLSDKGWDKPVGP